MNEEVFYHEIFPHLITEFYSDEQQLATVRIKADIHGFFPGDYNFYDKAKAPNDHKYPWLHYHGTDKSFLSLLLLGKSYFARLHSTFPLIAHLRGQIIAYHYCLPNVLTRERRSPYRGCYRFRVVDKPVKLIPHRIYVTAMFPGMIEERAKRRLAKGCECCRTTPVLAKKPKQKKRHCNNTKRRRIQCHEV